MSDDIAAKRTPAIPSSLYGVTPLDERHTPLNRKPPGDTSPTSTLSQQGVAVPKSCLGKFRTLGGSPKELWFAFVIKFLDSIAMFSLNLILVLFLTGEFGYSDVQSGAIYGAYGALSTLYGMFTGLIIDRIGVAKSLRLGIFLALISRATLFTITATPAGHKALLTVLLCILPLANSFVYPVLMIGVRRYTVNANRSYAYGLFYAVMNVGGLIAGPLIDIFRKYIPGDYVSPDGTVPEEEIDTFTWTPYRATLFVGVVLSAVELFLALFLNEIKVEEPEEDMLDGEGIDDDDPLINREIHAPSLGSSPGEPTAEEQDNTTVISSSSSRRTRTFVPSDTPALDSLKETLRSPTFWRFLVVGLIVTNMKMIFRHLDATLPKYMIREFGPDAPFGSIYAINPATVIILTPFLAAMISHVEELRVIRHGMFVSAASLIFIVLFGDTIWGCALFIFIFSVGEALWSPRYYILSVTSAKEGKEGVFAAFAFAPMFLAQLPVGALSGYLLQSFCPSEDYCDGQKLWGVIASISALSPIMINVLWPFIYIQPSEHVGDRSDSPVHHESSLARIDEGLTEKKSQLSKPLLPIDE